MRITLESDYALRIITVLAENNRVTDAGTISEETAVTPRFTGKILHKLVAGGLVRSVKGIHGGYALAKPAEEITMKTVIELIDGPISICRCLSDSEFCSRNGSRHECFYHRIFSDLSRTVTNTLDDIRIADVIRQGSVPPEKTGTGKASE